MQNKPSHIDNMPSKTQHVSSPLLWVRMKQQRLPVVAHRVEQGEAGKSPDAEPFLSVTSHSPALGGTVGHHVSSLTPPGRGPPSRPRRRRSRGRGPRVRDQRQCQVRRTPLCWGVRTWTSPGVRRGFRDMPHCQVPACRRCS